MHIGAVITAEMSAQRASKVAEQGVLCELGACAHRKQHCGQGHVASASAPAGAASLQLHQAAREKIESGESRVSGEKKIHGRRVPRNHGRVIARLRSLSRPRRSMTRA